MTQDGTTTATTYVYDGIALLSLSAERSDETTFSVAYLTDEDGRPYAGVYEGEGAASPVTFLIAATGRGDVVALTDTSGTPFARYAYDPYGAVLSQTSNAVTGISAALASSIAARQPLRYAGYVYDTHSATYYLSARHYDPATARFLSKDPARDDGEESAYQYCAGDPVGKVDPTGMWAQWTHHYQWTKSWAYRDLGWSTTLASWVAYGSADLDRYATSAVKKRWWHFNAWDHSVWNVERVTFGVGRKDSRRDYFQRQFRSAVLKWKTNRKDSLIELGRGIHAIQDCYAHGNAHPGRHLADQKSQYFDNSGYKPWRVSATRNMTLSLLTSFAVKVGLPHRRR
ncbi:MAG: RHS repeat-associated core domain-containing protein [Coriobacteriia bacterium]|nr:RHS repeat-associated core domain-containing protein [Coriobacteriia bacterium]